MHARAILLAALSLVAGCEHQLSAELLEVREISPDHIEAGHLLEARGAGFPVGRAGRMELDGAIARGGGRHEPLRYTLDAIAISDDRVEARVTAADLRAIGRGTFRGRVRIAFVAEGARGDVAGSRDDALIDFLPPSSHAGSGSPTPLAEMLGITTSDADVDRGLVIASVTSGSRAEAAGLVVGDRIVEIDGLRPAWAEELACAPEATRTELVIGRGESRVPIAIDVERSARDLRAALDARLYELAALVALVALLCSSRAGAALSRLRSPALRRTSAWLVGIGTIALLALLVVTGARAIVDALAVPLLLARIALVSLGGDASLRVRATRAALGTAGALATLAGVATLAALAGTLDPVEIEHAQQGLTAWGALRTPVGPAVIVLVALAVGLGAAEGARTSRWAQWLDDAALAGLAMSLGSYLAGGLEGSTTEVLLALGARFALYVLFAAARDATLGGGARLAGTGIALGITLGLTALATARPDLVPARHAAEVIAVCAIVVVLRAAMASAPPPPARPAHPLL